MTLYVREGHAKRHSEVELITAVANAIAGIVRRKRAERDRSVAQSRLFNSRRLEALGTLAAGVAHDFNNMLTVVTATADYLRESAPPDSMEAESAEEILTAAYRAASLARQLIAFGSRQVLRPRTISINAWVEGLREMLERLVGAHIMLRLELHANAGFLRADPDQITRVLMNLLVNARDAMPRGGEIVSSQ